tara:strand:- start:3792 stop:4970 length:1179 start_codon:yes stop_codon:yes gene_type:complete
LNKNILKPGVQEFIRIKKSTDIMSVLLKKQYFEGVDNKELAEQIAAREKCQKKLPTWFNSKEIYYPNKLNIEQTSSETTAKYKSDLVSGKSLIDLTGGFGVDSFYFSNSFEKIIHCEIDQELSKIVAHNYLKLQKKNVETINADGIEHLQKSTEKFDCIYLDPSRRDDSLNRVFLFSDCSPNIVENLPLLLSKCRKLLIKTSPLIDISSGMRELNSVKQIHIVAVDNDVKEILWLIDKEEETEVAVHTVNFVKTEIQKFSFHLNAEKQSSPEMSGPLTYLYEPNAAILKSGAFKSIAQAYNLKKLATNTHLYSSKDTKDFPGRIFRIQKVIPFQKKAILKEGIKKANVTTRNFPESVAKIRQRFKIKDGGIDYLFFTTLSNGDLVIIFCLKE